MTAPSRRVPLPSSVRVRDALGAAAIATVILAVSLAGGMADAGAWVDLCASLIACTALIWRRDQPVIVLVAIGGVFAVVTVAFGDASTALIPAVVALYTAVSRASTIAAAVAIGAMAVVAVGAVLVADGSRTPTDVTVVSAAIWMAMVTAIGIAVSLYRRSVAQERDRARQAEATRDALARSRVAEERLRIARELHDAVGHHIAVMNVQAGLAETLIDADPPRAAEALTVVQDAGSRVLEELPVMLRVLRQGEDDVRPTQGIGDIEALIEESRAAGLAVELSIADLPENVAAAADHGAYRILQEALTNARKHGDGSAAVDLRGANGSLHLEVRNRIGNRGSPAPSGFGALGMRERAAAAQGTVTAVREGDDFVLRATLPVRQGED